MEIGDLAGVSKPATKLLETIGGGFDKLYAPRLKRKMADAEAYEIKKISDTLKDIDNAIVEYNNGNIHISNKELLGRTCNRILNQETHRQENIESIIEKSYKELENETEASDEPVDKDWLTRFFNIAQDISYENIQILWAKILAEEVKQPNTFSFRTLDTLKNISHNEAQLFNNLAQFLFYNKHSNYILFRNTELLDKYKFPFSNIMILQDAGLISSNTMVELSFYGKSFNIMNNNIIAFIDNKNSDFQLPIMSITTVGIQILSLIEDKCNNNDFFIDSMNYLRNEYKYLDINAYKIINKTKNIDQENYNVRYDKSKDLLEI